MNDIKISKIMMILFAVVFCFGHVGLADPIGTAFTYQGRLIDANQAADGLYDFQFKMFDANSAGSKLGADINKPEVDVIDGYFTAELDFGSVFDGNNRWLEIGVRPGDQSDPCAYSLLNPRQKITPTPYALAMRGILLNIDNTFLGLAAGNSNTTGSQNTFSGSMAGMSNTTGNANTFLGYNAGWMNTTGNSNTFSGYGAGYSNSTGTGNAFSGQFAGYSNTAGSFNTFSGLQAGYSNITGAGNVFLGFQAGYNETGSNKLYIANSSANPPLIYGDFSTGNVGIGTTSPAAKLEVAGQVKITGGSPGTGKVLTSDSGGLATWQTLGTGDNLGNHTAIQNIKLSGYWLSGDGGNEGVYVANDGNVGIGTSSPATKLSVNGDISADSVYKISGSTVLSIAGTANTFIGVGAGPNSTGNYNTFSGTGAGYYNTTGSWNTFSGSDAGASNTTGHENTFSGYRAGYSNTTGNLNTFSGVGAGYSNTAGNGNTFSGYDAGWWNTIGSDNTFLGERAGQSNTSGSSNTFSGYWAGNRNTTGGGNTFSGHNSGCYNNTGGYNTFLGENAGYSNTTSPCNTYLGYEAGFYSTGSNNVFIGAFAGFHETGSYKLYIANSNVNPPLIYGDFSTHSVGISLTNPTEALDVNGTIRLRGIGNGTGTYVVADANGKLWKQSSSIRYKTNIETLDTGEDAVLKLRPVRFEYKESGQKDIGLIAEEVEKISPDLVIYDGQGRPDAVKYDKVALYLLSVVKNQQKESEDTKNRLAAMESLVSKLSQQEGGIK